jgi:hypothetical protein
LYKAAKNLNEPRLLPVKAIFVVTLKSNLRHLPLQLPYWGYKMSCGRSLSRDLLIAKTASGKDQIIKNSTQNQIFLKNEPVLSGVAMSELSKGTKKHTSKSCETIPLKNKTKMPMQTNSHYYRTSSMQPITGDEAVLTRLIRTSVKTLEEAY